ncbi:MAG: ferrous iron transport protein B [Deinococcales bacterium]
MSMCHEAGAGPSVTSGATPVVALAGNPNCGKTTLFNLLTGARQHIGNWPGVTVERREGTASLHGRAVSVVDLPGVYSLLGGGGPDQVVARDVLLDGRIDLVVNIVDASNLERHLALTAELAETGRPMIVALNMVDEARAAGREPRASELAAALGVPVVPMVARRGTGRRELIDALQRALHNAPRARPPAYHPAVERAVTALAALAGDAGAARGRFEALRLLDGAAAPRTPALTEALRRASEAVETATGEAAADMVAAARFGWAHDVALAAAPRDRPTGARWRLTEALDRIVLSGWLGVPVFLLVLYLVFVVSFSGGNILLDFFDQASAALLVDGLGHALLAVGLPGWLVSVVAGGLGGGLNLVVTFIPPIGLTFLLLAVLEDSGYMARAAYAMDRFMRRLGLPGNALVPMVIGFGCNVPAIMGSRIIDDPRGRLVTVLMQPFMSCSARLTIYMAFAVVFFRHHGGQVVFLLYVLGIVVALVTAWLLGKTALPGEPMPFVMGAGESGVDAHLRADGHHPRQLAGRVGADRGRHRQGGRDRYLQRHLPAAGRLEPHGHVRPPRRGLQAPRRAEDGARQRSGVRELAGRSAGALQRPLVGLGRAGVGSRRCHARRPRQGLHPALGTQLPGVRAAVRALRQHHRCPAARGGLGLDDVLGPVRHRGGLGRGHGAVPGRHLRPPPRDLGAVDRRGDPGRPRVRDGAALVRPALPRRRGGAGGVLVNPLFAVRDRLREESLATSWQLASDLQLSPAVVEDVLGHWLRRGQVERIELGPQGGCGGRSCARCGLCSSAGLQPAAYRWRGPGGRVDAHHQGA